MCIFLIQSQKLRTIVHESERRSEGYRDKMNEMLVDRERLQTELERLLQDSRKYVNVSSRQ